MLAVLDLVEEVAEVAAQVARLTNPQHTAAAQRTVIGQHVAVPFNDASQATNSIRHDDPLRCGTGARYG